MQVFGAVYVRTIVLKTIFYHECSTITHFFPSVSIIKENKQTQTKGVYKGYLSCIVISKLSKTPGYVNITDVKEGVS